MHETIQEIIRSKITIIANEDEAVGKYNEQEQCPLFTLPREIREMVWAYVTAPYEDPDGKFDEKAFYYRPGHTARLKTETALLHTCRRVWLEANAMPMLQAEHTYYYIRGPSSARTREWMAKLTAHNRENLGHLHLFIQLHLVESLGDYPGALRTFFLQPPPRPGDFQPRMFHVTIRHTDWYHWRDNIPLRYEYDWVQALLNTDDLRSTETLKLELETLDYKVDQLQRIVEQIKRLESSEIETHVIDGVLRKSKFELVGEPQVYTWEGPADINSQSHAAYRNMTRFKYHVVTLTWKLTFPEAPDTVVSKVRRVNRVTDAAWQKMILPRVKYSQPFDMRSYPSRAPLRYHYGGKEYASGGEPADQPIPIWKWWYAETRLQQISQEQALFYEGRRRLQFLDQLTDLRCKELKAKWVSERTLLKIEE